MNNSTYFALNGSYRLCMIRLRWLALLCAMALGSVAHSYAQTANPIIEKTPTFLDYQLERGVPTLDVQWSWSKVEGQRHAYEIDIRSPESWATAHLCVDGQLAKTIPTSVSHFNWSFKSLPVGKHMVSLLITDEYGEIGMASRPIRIR